MCLSRRPKPDGGTCSSPQQSLTVPKVCGKRRALAEVLGRAWRGVGLEGCTTCAGCAPVQMQALRDDGVLGQAAGLSLRQRARWQHEAWAEFSAQHRNHQVHQPCLNTAPLPTCLGARPAGSGRLHGALLNWPAGVSSPCPHGCLAVPACLPLPTCDCKCSGSGFCCGCDWSCAQAG